MMEEKLNGSRSNRTTELKENGIEGEQNNKRSAE